MQAWLYFFLVVILEVFFDQSVFLMIWSEGFEREKI